MAKYWVRNEAGHHVLKEIFGQWSWAANLIDIFFSSGKVGIGTATPGAELHVKSPGAGVAAIFEDNKADGTASIRVDAQFGSGWFGTFGNYPAILRDGVNFAYYYDVNNDFSILKGSVGIGTQSPATNFHVVKAVNSVALLESTAGINFLELLSHNGGGNFGSVIEFQDGATLSASIASVADGRLWFSAVQSDYRFSGLNKISLGTDANGMLMADRPVVLNALLWGCDNAGASDCSTIVQNMFAALDTIPAVGNRRGGVLYFPAGRYKFTNPIGKTYPSPASASTEYSITVCGDGPGATQFISSSNAFNLLSMNLRDYRHSFHCRDIAFIADGALSACAALYVATDHALGDFARNSITRCAFVGKGEGASTSYWGCGLAFQNVCGNSVKDCVFAGSATGLNGNGLQLQGTGGGQTTIFTDVHQSHFINLANGIVYNTEAQGVTVVSCNFQPVQCGIYVAAGSNQLQLNVTDSQFDTRTYPAIYVNGGQMTAIKGCVFVTPAGIDSIFLGPSQYNVVTGNLIIGVGGTPSGACVNTAGFNSIITGNVFSGHQYGVYADAGAGFSIVSTNRYNGITVANIGGPNSAAMTHGSAGALD